MDTLVGWVNGENACNLNFSVHNECPPKVWIHHAVNSSNCQSSRKMRGLEEEGVRGSLHSRAASKNLK